MDELEQKALLNSFLDFLEEDYIVDNEGYMNIDSLTIYTKEEVVNKFLESIKKS